MNTNSEQHATSTPNDLEQELDAAVAESFPASDPVSLAQPHSARELRRRDRSGPSPLVVGGVLLLLALLALR